MNAASGKREKNKLQNRAEILDAARKVFSELGYDAATVRDIIRRTELASGTFYNYFTDKEDVFRALLHELELKRRERLRKARLKSKSVEEYVELGFRGYFEFVAEDPEMFELLRRNASTIRAFSEDPALIEGLHALREQLRGAIARGEMPAMDVQYLASAMFGVAFEIAARMVGRQPVDVDGATRFATTLFLGGLERAQRAAVNDAADLERERRKTPRRG